MSRPLNLTEYELATALNLFYILYHPTQQQASEICSAVITILRALNSRLTASLYLSNAVINDPTSFTLLKCELAARGLQLHLGISTYESVHLMYGGDKLEYKDVRSIIVEPINKIPSLLETCKMLGIPNVTQEIELIE